MKIGLSFPGTAERNIFYQRWLKGKDKIEIIEFSSEKNNLEQLKDCDGLVLSGGVDVHPRFYGKDTNYPHAPKNFREDRDAFEINAFHLALQLNKPILGICRGMQLVNCALGGDLQQDLGEWNRVHRDEEKDKAHAVNLKKGTRLFELVGSPRAVVNSAHHQALGKIAEGLKVNCTSDEGIVEGVEWEDE